MRIYTRGGDRGQTSLFKGGRVPKSAPRVEAYGAVDELNAWLGLIRAQVAQAPLPEADREAWVAFLGTIHGWLFQMGAVLATPRADEGLVPPFPEEATRALERAIDRLEAALPPLQTFILPGGTPLAAQIHVARTVARRAERRVVALHQEEPVPAPVLTFLNRLSDYLFVLARAVNRGLGAAEESWRP